MKENKNIDRLFQEKLKDFEAIPDAQTWNAISQGLHSKEKNRFIIPMWFRYAGIAAVFILGFLLFKNQESVTIKTSNAVVIENDTVISKPIKNSSSAVENQEAVVFQENNQDSLAEVGTRKNKQLIAVKKSKTANAKYRFSNPLKLATTTEFSNEKDKSKVVVNSLADEKTAQEAVGNLDKSEKNRDEAIASTKPTALENEESVIPNALEELLKANTENSKKAVVHTKKWEISPNVAPIYLNANSGGSPIDNELSSNTKTADNTISYGLGVKYALNDKIKIRTGINKVILGYNTNDVYFTAGLATNAMSNIRQKTSEPIELQSATTFNNLSPSITAVQKTNLGNLNQVMGYYEVPFEISYAVVDRKVGINVIGGFSTLFLNENEISLVTPQANTVLGEASNLNKVHLSTNIGLGFKYQFMKSFQLNFEPMLKYQLKTFSKDSNNFQPVFIGLYSGVSYQF
ncbi:hypothetical protein [Flavobacterium frigidarium]|uniref:hypothetical protein n=1 Tax=Flavobacterium frigidarium TaxID=99286 RepID=UPI0030DB84CF|tara:strand:- start:21529 stop:22908 length:1380 start_codon:yes stop_codon:yes gene_type:complete